MAGEDSLLGLVYQQRYAHYRVLSQLALDLAKISGGPAQLVRFIVEGRGGVGGPIWDIVFEFPSGVLDLHECKDTLIAKEDRLTFYDRLRREVAGGTPVDKIRPLWVTDPNKQTANGLSYLEGIPLAVTKADWKKLPATLPERIGSSKTALQEAIWRLCHYTGEKPAKKTASRAKRKKKSKPVVPAAKWPQACTLDEAKTLLVNLSFAQESLVRVRAALALAELVVRPDATNFQAMVDLMLATRFAALIALPLLSLLDAGDAAEKKRDWQDALRLQPLADARVTKLKSLSEVRRLPGRQLSSGPNCQSITLVSPEVPAMRSSVDRGIPWERPTLLNQDVRWLGNPGRAPRYDAGPERHAGPAFALASILQRPWRESTGSRRLRSCR